MKWLWIVMLAWSLGAMAQEETNETPKPAEEDSGQKATRQISVRDLREADEKLNKEREVLTKSERRIAQLLEQLENSSQALATRETTLQDMLAKSTQGKGEDEFRVPQVQIDYWDKRNPVVAAKDFAPLYISETRIAVDIIKRMKKKNAARLIDEVSKLEEGGINGIEIAAKLNEAVGISETAKK